MAKPQQQTDAIKSKVKTVHRGKLRGKLRGKKLKVKKLKNQLADKKTVKSAKLVLTILFVVLTALFSYGRTLNSHIPTWFQIPTWPQIYEFVGLHLEEYIEIPDAPLVVSFIDVGQGDCAFIKTKEADILIDAGESESAETVIEYLNLYNVDDLEYIIATHPHSDHVGALPQIMEEIEVEKLLLPVKSEKTTDGIEYRDELLQIAREKNIEVTEVSLDNDYENSDYEDSDCEIALGELSLRFLGPIVDDENLNNTSLIVKLTFGETSFLFTGDAEKLEEYTLLSRDFEQGGGTLKSDVLKVAHHGSNTSSTSDFIEAVCPEYAVISSGTDNPYGHPHSETLLTLAEAGCTIWKTADCGHVVFAVKEGGEISILRQLRE